MSERFAVIMAGGSGTRLWPMSRGLRPKQLLRFGSDGRSLLRASVDRLSGLFDPAHIFIITAEDHLGPMTEDLPTFPRSNLIGEPVGRDTANAVGLAASVLAARSPDGTMGVFTADQLIEPVDSFQRAVGAAFEAVEAHPDHLATFGIKPTWAHTGLGYVHRGEPFGSGAVPTFRVRAFKEKPDAATAQGYVAGGEYYWNSGMFVWKVRTILDLLERFLPENAPLLVDLGRQFGQEAWKSRAGQVYPTLKKISIDFAVMEKAPKVLVVELNCRWADVGSWPELENLTGLDGDGNAVLAKALAVMDSGNNVVVSSEDHHLIALIGVKDLVVVHTPDATLVCPKDQCQRIKQLVGQLEERYGKKYT